jgi:hypothetical protein
LFCLQDDLGLGVTIFPLAASASQPAIRQAPPIGVTGPKDLYFLASNTRRYMLPENIVIPAVKSAIAIVFPGATTEVIVRTTE